MLELTRPFFSTVSCIPVHKIRLLFLVKAVICPIGYSAICFWALAATKGDAPSLNGPFDGSLTPHGKAAAVFAGLNAIGGLYRCAATLSLSRSHGPLPPPIAQLSPSPLVHSADARSPAVPSKSILLTSLASPTRPSRFGGRSSSCRSPGRGPSHAESVRLLRRRSCTASRRGMRQRSSRSGVTTRRAGRPSSSPPPCSSSRPSASTSQARPLPLSLSLFLSLSLSRARTHSSPSSSRS